MSNFPLYDKLNKDIQAKDLTAKQKTDFITKIEKMDQNGFNIIYILIKIYAIKENNQKLIILIYVYIYIYIFLYLFIY